MSRTVQKWVSIVGGLIVLFVVSLCICGCGSGGNGAAEPAKTETRPAAVQTAGNSAEVSELQKQNTELRQELAEIKAIVAAEKPNLIEDLRKAGGGSIKVGDPAKIEAEAEADVKRTEAEIDVQIKSTKLEEQKLLKKQAEAEEAEEQRLQLQDRIADLKKEVRRLENAARFLKASIEEPWIDSRNKAWRRAKLQKYQEDLTKARNELAEAEAKLL